MKPSAGGSSNYVADWVMDVLNDLIGRVDEDIIVDTTIDAAVQAMAEKALIEEVSQKGEKFGVQQGALVAMTTDGAVRALVGGRSYAENQFNRASRISLSSITMFVRMMCTFTTKYTHSRLQSPTCLGPVLAELRAE